MPVGDTPLVGNKSWGGCREGARDTDLHGLIVVRGLLPSLVDQIKTKLAELCSPKS